MKGHLKASEPAPTPTRFGEVVAADHVILGYEGQYSRHGDMSALAMQYKATMWLYAYLNAASDAENVERALDHCVGSGTVDKFYSDGAK